MLIGSRDRYILKMGYDDSHMVLKSRFGFVYYCIYVFVRARFLEFGGTKT